ncbi:Uncharacterized protein SCF082_LOCUS37075 [Durusdinium trenchii]|uniref:Uncharacterized protein n=1 Tax=Durusdinium trenchii TaxID=1381693 RepID=A0ABP0PNM5_9DINO
MGKGFESKATLFVYLWLVIQMLTLVFIGTSWKSSLRFFKECESDAETLCAKTPRTVSFASLWQMVISFVLTVGGVRVLRHHRNLMSLGVFVGISFAMANWMLCMAVDYASLVTEKKDVLERAQEVTAGPIGKLEFKSVVEAAAATAVLLVLTYGMFGSLLLYYRNDFVGGKAAIVDDLDDDDATGCELSPTNRIVSVKSPPAFNTTSPLPSGFESFGFESNGQGASSSDSQTTPRRAASAASANDAEQTLSSARAGGVWSDPGATMLSFNANNHNQHNKELLQDDALLVWSVVVGAVALCVFAIFQLGQFIQPFSDEGEAPFHTKVSPQPRVGPVDKERQAGVFHPVPIIAPVEPPHEPAQATHPLMVVPGSSPLALCEATMVLAVTESKGLRLLSLQQRQEGKLQQDKATWELPSAVSALDFSADGLFVAATTLNGEVHLAKVRWDPANGLCCDPMTSFNTNHRGSTALLELAGSAQRPFCVTGCKSCECDRELKFWNVSGELLVKVPALDGNKKVLDDVLLTGDGRQMVLLSSTSDPSSARTQVTLLRGEFSPATGIPITPCLRSARETACSCTT